MDRTVQVWHRCRVDKTIYHCAEYQRKNTQRPNHLVCLEEKTDANANFRIGMRPEHLVDDEFYVHVKFYCVHKFRGEDNMLMYSGYRKVCIHDGLVEDLGHHYFGFQDVMVLQHLCAEVPGDGGYVYIIDAPELMEQCLRDDLME
jgi:hypothetical protein